MDHRNPYDVVSEGNRQRVRKLPESHRKGVGSPSNTMRVLHRKFATARCGKRRTRVLVDDGRHRIIAFLLSRHGYSVVSSKGGIQHEHLTLF